MSDARAKAEARKKKILERGSDRMAIATGQKASTGSTSWRKKKASSNVATETQPVRTIIEYACISTSNKDISAVENKDTPCLSDKVKASDNSDKKAEALDSVKNESSNTSQTVDIKEKNSDNILNDIVDSIDISEFISQDGAKVREESTKRVLSSVKDYNPVEREKSKAKRKALEQEIARQTEEFDRLAEATRKKNASKTGVEDETCKSKGHKNKADEATVTRTRMELSPLSRNDWVHIVRCVLLATLGVCIGCLSFQDTVQISSLHSAAIDDYLSGDKATDTSRELLLKYASEQGENSVSHEIVSTVLPAIWRENSSHGYILLHYPVLVVVAVIFAAKFFMARMMVAESLVADKAEGGYLASLLAVAMGDFSGITAPLSAFIGDCCLYTLTICLVTAICQKWYGNDSQPINDALNLGNEL